MNRGGERRIRALAGGADASKTAAEGTFRGLDAGGVARRALADEVNPPAVCEALAALLDAAADEPVVEDVTARASAAAAAESAAAAADRVGAVHGACANPSCGNKAAKLCTRCKSAPSSVLG